MDIKDRNLPAIRVSEEDKLIIQKAALKDCRSISSYILTNILRIAKKDIR